MTNKAAIAGGDSIEEREMSMPKGLGGLESIVKWNHGMRRPFKQGRGITVS